MPRKRLVRSQPSKRSEPAELATDEGSVSDERETKTTAKKTPVEPTPRVSTPRRSRRRNADTEIKEVDHSEDTEVIEDCAKSATEGNTVKEETENVDDTSGTASVELSTPSPKPVLQQTPLRRRGRRTADVILKEEGDSKAVKPKEAVVENIEDKIKSPVIKLTRITRRTLSPQKTGVQAKPQEEDSNNEQIVYESKATLRRKARGGLRAQSPAKALEGDPNELGDQNAGTGLMENVTLKEEVEQSEEIKENDFSDSEVTRKPRNLRGRKAGKNAKDDKAPQLPSNEPDLDAKVSVCEDEEESVEVKDKLAPTGNDMLDRNEETGVKNINASEICSNAKAIDEVPDQDRKVEKAPESNTVSKTENDLPLQSIEKVNDTHVQSPRGRRLLKRGAANENGEAPKTKISKTVCEETAPEIQEIDKPTPSGKGTIKSSKRLLKTECQDTVLLSERSDSVKMEIEIDVQNTEKMEEDKTPVTMESAFSKVKEEIVNDIDTIAPETKDSKTSFKETNQIKPLREVTTDQVTPLSTGTIESCEKLLNVECKDTEQVSKSDMVMMETNVLSEKVEEDKTQDKEEIVNVADTGLVDDLCKMNARESEKCNEDNHETLQMEREATSSVALTTPAKRKTKEEEEAPEPEALAEENVEMPQNTETATSKNEAQLIEGKEDGGQLSEDKEDKADFAAGDEILLMEEKEDEVHLTEEEDDNAQTAADYELPLIENNVNGQDETFEESEEINCEELNELDGTDDADKNKETDGADENKETDVEENIKTDDEVKGHESAKKDEDMDSEEPEDNEDNVSDLGADELLLIEDDADYRSLFDEEIIAAEEARAQEKIKSKSSGKIDVKGKKSDSSEDPSNERKSSSDDRSRKIPESANRKSTTESKSHLKSPESKSIKSTPESKSCPKSPESKSRKSTPESKSRPKSPESKSMKSTPESKSCPKSPESQIKKSTPEAKDQSKSTESRSKISSPLSKSKDLKKVSPDSKEKDKSQSEDKDKKDSQSRSDKKDSKSPPKTGDKDDTEVKLQLNPRKDRVTFQTFKQVAILTNSLYRNQLKGLDNSHVKVIYEDNLTSDTLIYTIQKHRTRFPHKKTLWILLAGIYTFVEDEEVGGCKSCKEPLRIVNKIDSQAVGLLVNLAHNLCDTVQQRLGSTGLITIVPPIPALVGVKEDYHNNHSVMHSAVDGHRIITPKALNDQILWKYNLFCKKWTEAACERNSAFAGSDVFFRQYIERYEPNSFTIANKKSYEMRMKGWCQAMEKFLTIALETPFPKTKEVEKLKGIAQVDVPIKKSEREFDDKFEKIVVVGNTTFTKNLQDLTKDLNIEHLNENIDFDEDGLEFFKKVQGKYPTKTLWVILSGVSEVAEPVAAGPPKCGILKCENPLPAFATKNDDLGDPDFKGKNCEEMVTTIVKEAFNFATFASGQLKEGSGLFLAPIMPLCAIWAGHATSHSHDALHRMYKRDSNVPLFIGKSSGWIKSAKLLEAQWLNKIMQSLIKNTPPQEIIQKYKAERPPVLEYAEDVTLPKVKKVQTTWTEMMSKLLRYFVLSKEAKTHAAAVPPPVEDLGPPGVSNANIGNKQVTPPNVSNINIPLNQIDLPPSAPITKTNLPVESQVPMNGRPPLPMYLQGPPPGYPYPDMPPQYPPLPSQPPPVVPVAHPYSGPAHQGVGFQNVTQGTYQAYPGVPPQDPYYAGWGGPVNPTTGPHAPFVHSAYAPPVSVAPVPGNTNSSAGSFTNHAPLPGNKNSSAGSFTKQAPVPGNKNSSAGSFTNHAPVPGNKNSSAGSYTNRAPVPDSSVSSAGSCTIQAPPKLKTAMKGHLVINDIDTDMNECQARTLLQEFGELADIKWPLTDKDKPARFLMINFKQRKHAERAERILNYLKVFGDKSTVKLIGGETKGETKLQSEDLELLLSIHEVLNRIKDESKKNKVQKTSKPPRKPKKVDPIIIPTTVPAPQILTPAQVPVPVQRTEEKVITLVVSNFTTIVPLKDVNDMFVELGACVKGVLIQNALHFTFKGDRAIANLLSGFRFPDKTMEVIIKPAHPNPPTRQALEDAKAKIKGPVSRLMRKIGVVLKEKIDEGINVHTFKTRLCRYADGCKAKDLCPKFHDAGDRRRCLTLFRYSDEMCTRLEETGSCQARDKCSESHSPLEILFHFKNFRSSVCPSWEQNLTCDKVGRVCSYVHPEKPEMLYNEKWTNVYVEGLMKTLDYLTEAVKNLFLLKDMQGLRVLLVTKTDELAQLYVDCIKELAQSCNQKVSLFSGSTVEAGTSVLISSIEALRPIASVVGKYHQSKQLNTSRLKALILDDGLNLLKGCNRSMVAYLAEIAQRDVNVVVTAEKICHKDVEEVQTKLSARGGLKKLCATSENKAKVQSSAKSGSYRSDVLESLIASTRTKGSQGRTDRSENRNSSRDKSDSKTSSRSGNKESSSKSSSSSTEKLDDRVKALAKLEMEYQKALGDLAKEQERECQLYINSPEFHPDYEQKYSIFMEQYRVQYPERTDMNHSNTLWEQFWKELITVLLQEEYDVKKHALEKTYKEKKEKASKGTPPKESRGEDRKERHSNESQKRKASDDERSNHREKYLRDDKSSDVGRGRVNQMKDEDSDRGRRQQYDRNAESSRDSYSRGEHNPVQEERSDRNDDLQRRSKRDEITSARSSDKNMEETITVLMELCSSLGVLGPAAQMLLKNLAVCWSDKQKLYKLVQDEDNRIIMNRLSNKALGVSELIGSGKHAVMLKSASDQVLKLLDMPPVASENTENSKYFGLDVESIARLTYNMDPSYIVQCIKNALDSKGIYNASEKDITDIYVGVTSAHFGIAYQKSGEKPSTSGGQRDDISSKRERPSWSDSDHVSSQRKRTEDSWSDREFGERSQIFTQSRQSGNMGESGSFTSVGDLFKSGMRSSLASHKYGHGASKDFSMQQITDYGHTISQQATDFAPQEVLDYGHSSTNRLSSEMNRASNEFSRLTSVKSVGSEHTNSDAILDMLRNSDMLASYQQRGDRVRDNLSSRLNDFNERGDERNTSTGQQGEAGVSLMEFLSQF